ncbi:hypothetical protein DKX38_027750 [Salix brachista]|uniref:Uncharacterized protein n=1 Tax=Salix brachista TaxID=2182728 RepID=A0A5N5J7W1_9ROSI|nr:hypothetical protein DKX38_027750 [Salix brachista]
MPRTKKINRFRSVLTDPEEITERPKETSSRAKIRETESCSVDSTPTSKPRVLAMACQLQLCIASGSSDKTVRLWDVQSGERVRIFIGHRSMILSLAMSPDGRHMASADEDGTIKTWDLSSGRCISPLIDHNSCVWSLMARFNKA